MTARRKIDRYSFGRMSIEGREYTSDLIIHADGRIQDSWWRAEGHRLVPDDIGAVLDSAPAQLVVGTGADGLMRVSSSVLESCQERGIEVEACPTAEAVRRYNRAAEQGAAVAACFHLTC
jgi:hypothetical protein